MKIQTLSILALICVCLAGCRPSPRNMIGASLAGVEAQWGAPDIKSENVMPSEPTGLPMPVMLKAGDTYLFVHYTNIKDRQWHLWFVKPDMYSRVKGKVPGSADWYLLETADYDKDLRF